MADFFKDNKNIFVVIIVVMIAFAIMNFLPKSSDKAEKKLLVVNKSDNATGDLGRDLLALLSRLKSIQIDGDFFKDEVFKSLQDFGREISPKPSGREDPFAPFNVTP